MAWPLPFRDCWDALDRSWNANSAGIAWAFWHLPLFIISGTPQYGTGFLPSLSN